MYFSCDTLTTVGLGNHVPKSNLERVLMAFSLLYGVAIISVFVQEVLGMIEHWQDFDVYIEDGDLLSKFFGVLKKFNYDQPISM